MVQIENYKPFETDVWFYAEEGNATKYTDEMFEADFEASGL